VGSYLAGPSVIDFVGDFSTGTIVIVAAVLVFGACLELARRHRRPSRRQPKQRRQPEQRRQR
jgi:hypothetical protein